MNGKPNNEKTTFTEVAFDSSPSMLATREENKIDIKPIGKKKMPLKKDASRNVNKCKK